MLRLINPAATWLRFNDPRQLVEAAGRTCYKSEAKVTADSAPKFVQMLIHRGHESVLEHAYVALQLDLVGWVGTLVEWWHARRRLPRALIWTCHDGRLVASANVRVWRDLARVPTSRVTRRLLAQLAFGVELGPPTRYAAFFTDLLRPEDLHRPWWGGGRATSLAPRDLTPLELRDHLALTLRLVCGRGTSHELVRHRVGSYSQESTRYCDYAGGVAMVVPEALREDLGPLANISLTSIPVSVVTTTARTWLTAALRASNSYAWLRASDVPAQVARGVLPTDLKTEVVATLTLRWWGHLLGQRLSPAAHPDMRALATLIQRELAAAVSVLREDPDYL